MKYNYPAESFISFIWNHQKFRLTDLKTQKGESLIIKKPGYLNTDSGPDFQEGSIIIGKYRWDGCIELHVKSSDWYEHGHQFDANYENVILHVVWEYNTPVLREDGTEIPTLEIRSLVDHSLVAKYKNLTNGFNEIPCSNHLANIDPFHINSQLEKVAIERLKEKSENIKSLLMEFKNDWEEIAYISLAKNFGFKLNSAPFELLARTVPYKIIRQNRGSQLKLESLLFGMSNIHIQESEDDYTKKLESEFFYLEKKYNLAPRLTGNEWKFMRTRPDNFPTVRIAQLSSLLFKHNNLFTSLIEEQNLKNFYNFFNIEMPQYWKSHYKVSRKRVSKREGIGKSSIDNILINTVAPLKVAYGIESDNHNYIEEAIELLGRIKPESNKYTRKMSDEGFKIDNALQSQAAIHQLKNYCLKSKCLSCELGYQILNN